MYKIIIIDDELNSRDNNITALISTVNSNTFAEERQREAAKHYSITEFSIAGEAIKLLEAAPSKKDLADLILLDISFAQLHDDDITEKGFDANIETSETRGFDVFDCIQDEIQTILFTAYDRKLDSIADEIVARENLTYTSMLSKVAGINHFANIIRKNLEAVANQLIANANVRDFRQLENLISQEKPSLEDIISVKIRFDDRVFTVQNFFIYKFRLDADGKNLIADADFVAYVCAFFSSYIQHEGGNPIPNFLGNFNRLWAHQLILGWRRHDNFQMVNDRINRRAANCIVEFFRISHKHEQQEHIKVHLQIFRGCNIGNQAFVYGDVPQTNNLEKALTARRVFIGLNHLANENIWGIGVNRDIDHLFDLIMNGVKRTNTEENCTFFLTTTLGFSIQQNFEYQRLNIDIDNALNSILREERAFTDIFVPQILAKMQRRNGVQPNPDYTFLFRNEK